MSKRLGGVLLIVMLLSACAAGAATPEPDRVGTRVAEELAVSQTLTAVAKAAVPAATAVAQVEPSATPEPPVSDEPTVAAPTAAAPKPPTPTKTAQPQQADPFVPGGGDPKGLIGKMILPGYGGTSEQVDAPIFNQQIVFQLFVYDPNFGNKDGAGINSVTMQIFDPNGQVVQSRTENNAAYCAFGNDRPECPAWKFAEHGNQWPDGTPVCTGAGYQAVMTVDAKDDNNDGALWQFNFAIDGDYPPC
jgi:hypothetical protein